MYKSILKRTLPPTELQREYSWGAMEVDGGPYESTMEVFVNEYGVPTCIEWDIPALDEGEHIGLEIEGNNVVGFDGVMCIPQEAIDILKELGYNTEEIE